jgi:hypothetical protein
MSLLLSQSAGRPKDELVGNKSKLAPLVGLSVTSLDRYIGKGAKIHGPPYSVETTKREIERVRAEHGQLTAGGTTDLQQERLRVEIADKLESCRYRKLKNDVMEGRLYNAREVDTFLNAEAVLIKSRLELFPAEFASEAPSALKVEAHELATKAINRLLLELSGQHFTASGVEDDEE